MAAVAHPDIAMLVVPLFAGDGKRERLLRHLRCVAEERIGEIERRFKLFIAL